MSNKQNDTLIEKYQAMLDDVYAQNKKILDMWENVIDILDESIAVREELAMSLKKSNDLIKSLNEDCETFDEIWK